jgi:hypothetical protein
MTTMVDTMNGDTPTPGTLASVLDAHGRDAEETAPGGDATVTEETAEDGAGLHDGAEVEPEEPESGNAREARYRVRARAAEERAEAAETALAAVQGDRVRELAERSGLVDGAELLAAEGVELGDLLDDRGAPDPERVAEAVKKITSARPWLDRANLRPPHEFGQGSRGGGPTPPSWADVFRRR